MTENRQKSKLWSNKITASRQKQAAPKQFKKYLSSGTNKTELLQIL